MRLADVLSKPSAKEFVQIDGFMKKRLLPGKQRKIEIGQVYLTFFCVTCNVVRTFASGSELYCRGISDKSISIDIVTICPACKTAVQTWYIVESDKELFLSAPYVRIIKYSDRIPENVRYSECCHGEYYDYLSKAQHAYREGLCAGAMVYLRQLFELLTYQTADDAKISRNTDEGTPKSFSALLNTSNA